MIHGLVRIIAAAWRRLCGPRTRVHSFVGSTVLESEFPPTRVTLPFPRRKGRR